MRNLKFYGASDDLFEIEGTAGSEPDEVGAYDKMVAVTVQNEHAGLRVAAYYMPDGVWMIGVCQRAEDDPLPDWPMKFSTAKRGYSSLLEIEAPDSAVVSLEGKYDGPR